MYKNWQDWQGGALDVWKETPASDIGEGLIRHEWQGEKYNLLQKGTTLKADVMNSLQMGLDFLIDSNHTVVNSEDHYIITIDGLKTSTSNPDGYELSDNLHFSIKITEENANGISKLIINGDSYDLQKKISTGTVDLEASDLQADKICRVYYDGTRFIVDASSLPATDTTAGVNSKNDIRTVVSELSGGKYDGLFGSSLTSITKDKTYVYYDSNGVGTVYVALQNNTNSSGFLSPDTVNFENITNMKFKDNGKKANYTALRGLVLDADIFEVVSSTAGLLFTVKVKKTGTYNLSSTVFANFTENALVRILTYLNSTLYLSIRNTANYKSTTAGLDLSEQMVMPSITIDAVENDTLSIQVTGTTSVGSEWGFFITKVR